MADGDLADKHLAELHALAAGAGVPKYRLLRRDELIDRIREHGGGEVAERREQAPTEPVAGVLDVLPQRYGFLRLRGLAPAADDVYISASQIRRCELRPGDEVAGPAREPGRGERYRALVHVDLVNGADPSEEGSRPDFDALTPVAPRRRLRIEPAPADLLTRAVDLLVPLAYGQRLLVRAAPRSGRTTLLRGLGGAIQALEAGPDVTVLLIDERPEEATAWRVALPDAEIAAATADMSPADQARIADLALARAKRLVESGDDVVLICDSLSRLAVAHRDPAPAKALFGAGRELAEEGAGSLTLIATVLMGSHEDEEAITAVATTENAVVRLDPGLAAAGVYPAFRPADCRASDEEALREPAELEAVRRLRGLLAGLDPQVAAATLRERLESSRTNAELLSRL